jgi:hypothetical protein
MVLMEILIEAIPLILRDVVFLSEVTARLCPL